MKTHKNGQKQGEYGHKNLINNRKGVTFNHNQTSKTSESPEMMMILEG